VVHQLAGELFHGRSHAGSCLELDASSGSFRKAEGSKAFAEIERQRESWGDRIPGDPEKFWTWCLEQHRDTLLDLLAFCAACSINAVLEKADRPDCNRLLHADLLAQSVALDMKAWFTPDAANYFSRISKAGIIQALQEAKNVPPAPAWHGMKKSELALLAARETAGSGWLPALLRSRDSEVSELNEAA
jgi:ParB family chromosome partitioning protein